MADSAGLHLFCIRYYILHLSIYERHELTELNDYFGIPFLRQFVLFVSLQTNFISIPSMQPNPQYLSMTSNYII